MKEARCSFYRCAVINSSTLLQQYCGKHSTGKDQQITEPNITIQVLAAFTPDGFFNNNIISIENVV